jgi:cytochrome c biogenesis protein CcmG/thiol:disulfide interchange protein DsbE
MTDLQNAGDEKDPAQDEAHEERNDMSARTKPTGQQQRPTPPQRSAAGSWIAGIVAVVAIAVIIAYAVLHANHVVPGSATATGAPQLPPPLSTGSRAPAFALRSPIGTFSSSELAGKPYLLEIFATWCPHCQRMTSVLRDVRASVSDSKLSMLSVTGSPYAANSTPDNLVPENQADVDQFESRFGVTWPSFYDPELAVARAWGLDGFPTIFIVNAHGNIVYSSSGEVSKAELMRAIRQAGA